MIFNWQMAAEFKFIKCESVFLNLAFFYYSVNRFSVWYAPKFIFGAYQTLNTQLGACLVTEVSHTSKDHRNARFVGCCNNFFITHGATGLNNGLYWLASPCA